MAESIFQKIARGESDTEILFQDDRCFVIRDLNPVAPVHLLIIPFWKCTSLAYIGPGQEPLIGHLLAVAEEMARREGVALSGYRLVVNQGPDSGQEIDHLHVHLIGGTKLSNIG